MKREEFSQEVQEFIGDIVTYNTLPPQIDYTRPYRIKAQIAEDHLKAMGTIGEMAMDTANAEIEAYHESGAAELDAMF